MNNLHMTIVCNANLLVTKWFVVDGYFTCSCCQLLDSGSVRSLELSAVAQKAIVIPQIPCDSFFLWLAKNKILIIALNFVKTWYFFSHWRACYFYTRICQSEILPNFFYHWDTYLPQCSSRLYCVRHSTASE